MNEIIQSVLFDKNNFTVKKAIRWLKTRNLKYNDVDNNKPNYIHFRQEDPQKLENEGYLFKNKVFDNGTKIYIIAYKNGLKGGAISSENLQKFITSSYTSTDDDIDGYKKDKELSNAEISTFYNPSNNHAVAVFRGTEATLTDWSNNVAYVVGRYENTDRFKRAKEMYNKIVKKYGEKNISLVGHSQSAVITRKIGKNAKEIINVNPAHLFEKQKENEFNVRSSADVVSAIKPVADVYNKVKDTTTNALKSVANVFLPKSKKLKIEKNDKDVSNQNITIENKTLNPLTEHSSEILDRMQEGTMIGQGMKPLFNNYIVEVPTPMINKTNKGRLVEVNPITKTGNLTTRNKKKSVVIEISPDEEPHIKNNGKNSKTLKEFNSIYLQIPKLLKETKKNKIIEISPITKTGSLTTRNKQKSIILKPSKDNEIHFEKKQSEPRTDKEEEKFIKKGIYTKEPNEPKEPNEHQRWEIGNLDDALVRNSVINLRTRVRTLRGVASDPHWYKYVKPMQVKYKFKYPDEEEIKLLEEMDVLYKIIFGKIKKHPTFETFFPTGHGKFNDNWYKDFENLDNKTKQNKPVVIPEVKKTFEKNKWIELENSDSESDSDGEIEIWRNGKLVKPEPEKIIIHDTEPPKKPVKKPIKKIVKKKKIVKPEDSDTDDELDEMIKKVTEPHRKKKEEEKKQKLVVKNKPVEIVKEDIKNESESESDEEDDKLKLNNKQEEVVKGIGELLTFLKTGRKNFYIEKNQKLFETLRNAIMAYDFYPTPEKYSEEIYKLETTHYGLNNSHILDVGCGLLSLSLPFIQNAVDTTKIDLIEMNPDFYDIIKPLQSKNINIIKDDFFVIPTETFNKKGIDIILSNPPFAGSAEGDRTPLLYFYFLKKILDIAMVQNTETHIYFICPKTYFQSKNKWMKNGDVINVSNVIPKKTEKDINKFLNIKWMMDNEFNGQCEYLHDITGFRTLRRGKPVDLGLTVGLFRFSVRSGWGGGKRNKKRNKYKRI